MSTRVLIVEDDLELREAIADTLELAGFDFLQVGDGEQAVALLEQEPVDIVVTDVNMPGMGGIEATKNIRSQQEFRDIPVIGLTAEDTGNCYATLTSAGMNGILIKPINLEPLLATIREHVASE